MSCLLLFFKETKFVVFPQPQCIMFVHIYQEFMDLTAKQTHIAALRFYSRFIYFQI